MKKFAYIVTTSLVVLGNMFLPAINIARAQGIAYTGGTVAGNYIKVDSQLYTFAGKDTRTESQIYNWTIFTKSGSTFTCGDKVVVDNPATEGRIALRDTYIEDQTNPSPVLGADCAVQDSGEVLYELAIVESEDKCNEIEGVWYGSGCDVSGRSKILPLESGMCYTKSGPVYFSTDCTDNETPSRYCKLKTTIKEQGGSQDVAFVSIDCISGRQVTVTDDGYKQCESKNDRDCKQANGEYRCWDGSVIPIAPNVSCPPNTDAAQQSTCINSGGDWDVDDSNCVCNGDIVPQGGTCTTVSESFNEEPIQTDCESGLNSEECGIIEYLVWGINFLSAIAGMAIVASMMIAGYQYMTARDNSGQVEAAKKRIVWALIALGLFLTMYALLNWFIPGGVL